MRKEIFFRSAVAIFLVILIVVTINNIGTKIASAWNDNPCEKLTKGIVNAGFGWTEVPKAVLLDGPKSQGLWSVPLSPYNCLVGIFKGAFRTGGGVVDAFTFPGDENAVDDWPMEDLEIK